MVRLTETTQADVDQIREWLTADPWHKDNPRNDPSVMTTGNGLLAFCLQDNEGPVIYVRLDAEGKMIRIAMQFAPEEIVSRKRVAKALSEAGIPAMKSFGVSNDYMGLVFESVNEPLIRFGMRYGFMDIGNNDYALYFTEGQTHV